MTETWVPVAEFDGYEVSDQGRVRSTKAWRGDLGPRILKAYLGSAGYFRVNLYRDGKMFAHDVHVLVARAFLGPRPASQHTRHRNGLSTDNRLENLLYGTVGENRRDSVEHGTHFQARKTHCRNDHEFTESNTYITKRGARACRACAREAQRRYRKQSQT